MAVNIERLGPNSAVVTYGVTDTKADIYPVMVDFITQQGWELYDNYTENKYVFRAPMADNANVCKYMELDWATAQDVLAIGVYESWNNATHKGTNKTLVSSVAYDKAYNQAIKVGVWGTVWLFVSQRYLILHNRMQANTGGETWGTTAADGHFSWTGILEISKDNPGEVTGKYPRYAFGNAGMFSGVSVPNSAGLPSCFALPRSISNTTTLGDTCSTNSVGTLFAQTTSYANTLTQQLPENANPFDVNTAFSFTLWALASKYPTSTPAVTVPNHIRGRFYGVKALAKSTGSLLDIIKIPCDDDYFYLAEEDGGILKDHLIISSGANPAPSHNRFRWAIPL